MCRQSILLAMFVLSLAVFSLGLLAVPVEASAILENSSTRYDEPHHLIEQRVNLTSLVPISNVILCYYYAGVLETPANASMQLLNQTLKEQWNSTLWSVQVLAPPVTNITFVKKIYVIDFHGLTQEISLDPPFSWGEYTYTQNVSNFSPPTVLYAAAFIAISVIAGAGLTVRFYNHREKSNKKET